MLHKEKYSDISKFAFLLLAMILFTSLVSVMNAWAWRNASVQENIRKLDPVLKSLVLSGNLSSRVPALRILSPVARPYKPDVVNAIIKVSGNTMGIESTGVRIRSVIGDIITADVPFRSLEALINLSNVIYVQAARQMQPAVLDISVPDTGADQVWQSVPGYTGKGVIVGVIDTGIDWEHPDFKHKDGTSRILYIWDQTAPGLSPREYRYGTEWTKAQIDSGQCQQMDAMGHGTHVTSTAAGDGRDSHGFTGMAPEADIIMVKSTLMDPDIIDASSYIFRKAEELNRPAVINMSFGNHWGPHDGTDFFDQAMDQLLGQPGRAIVAAAGNDGGYPIHVRTSSLRRTTGGDYSWTAVLPAVGSQYTVLQVWYPPARSLSVRLLLPENDRGDLNELSSGWVSEGQTRNFSVPDGPLAGAEVVIDTIMYPNFDGFYIHVFDGGDPTIPVDEYLFAIEYGGAGVAMDAYILGAGKFTTDISSSISTPNRSFLLEGDGERTIGSPSSAASVICVASYVTRSEWVDTENRIRTENVKTGDISVFSSRGPLLNGARKPDIAAPGEMIVAAFSDDGWARTRSIYTDGEHVSWRGTSMASPHVTGAVALIYEQNPNLTASAIKNMLIGSAEDRGQAGWDKAWGYGKMDVLSAMGIPSAPDGLQATAGNGSITLTWRPNSENDIAGYRIYAALDTGYWMLDTANGCWRFDAGNWIPDGGCWMLTSSIEYQSSSIKYQVSSIENGIPVSLSVSAYDADGDEGPRSYEITVMPTPPGPDVTPPNPPDDLTAASVDSALDLTWSRNSEHDLAGYRVYYGTSSGNYTQSISAGKLTEYRLKNLTNNVRIYVAVSSSDTSGNESAKSKAVSAVPRLSIQPELRYQSGWPVSTLHDVYSSPTLYDMDGDGRLEVLVAAKDGRVYLLRHDGRYMPGWPISTGYSSISSPAVGDVDGDGRVEVVIGAGEMIFTWHSDGTPVSGWPVSMTDSVFASPALGDIDRDGKLEIVIGSRDGKVYAYNSDGSLVNGWPVSTYGEIRSSAAIGDINGDAKLEIVIGSGSGSLYVFNGDGTVVSGWPVYTGRAADPSPALGDIDGDGSMEIVAADNDGIIYAWRYNSDLMAGWPVDLQNEIISSPALGDIDGDEKTLEIAIGAKNGLIYVLKNDGSIMDGWPVSVMDYITSSPALGDIDGDGSVDVIIGTSTGQGHVGLVYALKGTGDRLGAMWPTSIEGNVCYSSPALGDLDGDGDVELVIGSCRQPGSLGGQIHVWDLTGRPTDADIPWGEFRHDPLHTGFAGDNIPPSFVIAALQNAALKKYVNLYIIASERLIEPPELTVEMAVPGQAEMDDPPDEMAGNLSSIIPLIQIDTNPPIYQAVFFVGPHNLYTFTISGTDLSGNSGYSVKTISIQLNQGENTAPANFSLLPNYPNPFNPGTWIPYELAQPAEVTIEIYSIKGQLIRSLNLGRRTAGSYTDKNTAAYWDGMDDDAQRVASGVYFYVLKAGKFRAVRKMILLQ